MLKLAAAASATALTSAAQCNPSDWQVGISFKNREYTEQNASSPADCCSACQKTTAIKCTYWTYTDGSCWLKDNPDNPIPCKTCTSGGINPMPPTPAPTPKPPTPQAPTPSTIPPTPWDGKPAKVYIMMGQSNMLGEGRVFGATTNGTLEYAVKVEKKYPYLWDAKTNDWAVLDNTRNVFIMTSGNQTFEQAKLQHNETMRVGSSTPGGSYSSLGPEFGIASSLMQQDNVMLLKSCIGDRALGWDLLPPGTASWDFTDPTGKTYTYAGYHQSPMKWLKGTTPPPPPKWMAGEQYDGDTSNAQHILSNIIDFYPGVEKYEVAGFFWWQGDKDSRDLGLATRYEYNLVNLIKVLRKQFNAPNAPFVTASLGQTVKGSTSPDGLILDAMLNVDGTSGKYPEFKGNVAAVYTHPLSEGGSSGGHYGKDARTYMNVGEAMGAAMAKMTEAQ